MALGASITFGTGSTDGNGYRQTLHDRLVTGGNKVDMVGSHPGGDMQDNQSEGWPGYVIDQVHSKAQSVKTFKPNVITLNAGTNDCIQNKTLDKAGERMESMLDDIWKWSPETTVILSGVAPSKDPVIMARSHQVNDQYITLAAKLRKEEKRIVYMWIQYSDTNTDGLMLTDISQDKIHPHDAGYVKLGNLWYKSIAQAAKEGLIQEAEDI